MGPTAAVCLEGGGSASLQGQGHASVAVLPVGQTSTSGIGSRLGRLGSGGDFNGEGRSRGEETKEGRAKKHGCGSFYEGQRRVERGREGRRKEKIGCSCPSLGMWRLTRGLRNERQC